MDLFLSQEIILLLLVDYFWRYLRALLLPFGLTNHFFQEEMQY